MPLQPILDSSPAPGLWVSGTATAPAWRANRAARQWPPCAGWPEDTWRLLAAAIVEQAQRAAAEGGAPLLEVAWSCLPMDDGWFAWLRPSGQRAQQRPDDRHLPLQMAASLLEFWLWTVDLRDQTYHRIGSTTVPRRMGTPLSPGGMPLARVRSMLHPDDRSKSEAANREAIAGPAAVDCGLRYLLPDGAIGHMLTRRIAVRDELGEAVAVVGVSVDISARIASEQRLAAMATELAALEQLSIGCWQAHRPRGTLTANAALRELLGPLAAEQTIAAAHGGWRSAIQPPDRPAVDALFDAIEQRAPLPAEMRCDTLPAQRPARRLLCRARWMEHQGERIAVGVVVDASRIAPASAPDLRMPA